MRSYLGWASLCSLLLWPSATAAQTAQTYDYLGVTTKVVIGANGDVLSNYDQVLKVIGLPSVSGGASSLLGVDSSGNVRQDSGSVISTGGALTLAQVLTLTSGVASPFEVSGGSSLSLAALGVDNARVGLNGGTPRMILEDTAGSYQIQLDNQAGQFRLARITNAGGCDPIGCVPLAVAGNMTLDLPGGFVLPLRPYTTSFGSIGAKFDSAYFSNLFIDTLVAFQTMATIDGRMLIGNGNIFDEDVSPSATTITTRVNNIVSGDYLIAEKNGRRESMKATSGATAMNKITDPSFEASATWDVSSGDSVSQSTAKAWDFNNSMLLTHGGSTLLQVAQPSARGTMSASTAYTTCLYMRRDDAAIPVAGDVQINTGSGTFVNMTIQDTQTDGWVRACASFTTPGTVTDGRYAFLNWTTTNSASSHDWYLDAVQAETGTKERPYSTSRAQYTVTRNLDSTAANQWYAGDSLFDLGGSAGYGWLDCYSISGLKTTTEVGPTCVANVRTASTNWNDWAPRAAWGQLNGLYDYSSSTFGFVAGDYANTWVSMDPTNGFRVKSGSTTKLQATAAGTLSLVEGALTLDNLGIRIQNTTSSSDEAKAYTFYGSGTPSHAKRPGLFYSEGSGTSTLSLAIDNGGISIQSDATTSLIGGSASDSQISMGTNFGITAANTLAITSNTITIDTPPNGGGTTNVFPLIWFATDKRLYKRSNAFSGTVTIGACVLTFETGSLVSKAGGC